MAKSLTALDRLLNDPDLPVLVPTLQPALLHRVIQARGLEDSVDLVAVATPAQLAQVLDADLWHAPVPGADETLDADRFGLWLAVLVEAGVAVAADKLAALDLDLIVEGLAQHLRVFDIAAASPYTTLDGEDVPGHQLEGIPGEIGGYAIGAKRDSAWGAILDLLAYLETERPEYFHRVMRGCVRLSSDRPEASGFHDLLEDDEQHTFDLSADRETRRGAQGFVTPAQAHAFLREARELCTDGERPPRSAMARAYFRAIGSTFLDANASHVGADVARIPHDHALAPVHLSYVHAYAAHHPEAEEELAFLANALVAGGAVQGRPFTPREASDAVVATANLGLENWPQAWPAPDLVTAFQLGWRRLHRDAALFAATRLTQMLLDVRCEDRDIQLRLDGLRRELLRYIPDEEPWRAREALDVFLMLDAPAWAALTSLIDSCPVMHAAITASGLRSIDPADFSFISRNGDIAVIREFMAALPSILTG
jgi:hypothetical protein